VDYKRACDFATLQLCNSLVNNLVCRLSSQYQASKWDKVAYRRVFEGLHDGLGKTMKCA
jgi:hypothetical protein